MNPLTGLIITSAVYGSDLHTIDVTIPLQTLVSSSALQITPSKSKSSLLGFYDPALAEAKTLKVIYTFKNKTHRVIVDDREALMIPQRSHQTS